jgi:RNA polymerase sigma factor (sigma-70 family)
MKVTAKRFHPMSLRPNAADWGDAHSRSIAGWLEQRLPAWPHVWSVCRSRTHKWRTPPRWSIRDWREELDAECIASAYRAIRNFDPQRGPSLESFVYYKVLAGALVRYRREWTYFFRHGTPCSLPDQPERTDAVDERFAAEEDYQAVLRLIEDLPDTDRHLIECLFWEGRTEKDVAGGLGISQQAVSKRKHRVLNELRNTLTEPGQD